MIVRGQIHDDSDEDAEVIEFQIHDDGTWTQWGAPNKALGDNVDLMERLSAALVDI